MEDKKHLIYKEDLLDLFTVQAPSMSYNKMFMAVANDSTVDAVEVVHGRWEWIGPYRYNDEGLIGTCSACKKRLRLFATNYCPNCGAMMDGDGNG